MPPLEITEVFYPVDRPAWRAWLQQHHQREEPIWLQRFRKETGKPSISYDDLVEECLCFGWIDGTSKRYDDDSYVQRITPRRKKSFLSELNRQRIWKLQAQQLIVPGALAMIADQVGHPDDPWEIPAWIQEALAAAGVWQAFCAYSVYYQRLKVFWITEARGHSRAPERQKRLAYLIKMTQAGKQYGTQPLA